MSELEGRALPGWYDDATLDVTPAAGSDVRLLGHAEAPLSWEATGSGCRVTLPGRPADAPALSLRITPAPTG